MTGAVLLSIYLTGVAIEIPRCFKVAQRVDKGWLSSITASVVVSVMWPVLVAIGAILGGIHVMTADPSKDKRD